MSDTLSFELITQVAEAMGMRDILSRHYFDLNAEIVFNTCDNKLPPMLDVLRIILKEL